MNTALVGNRGSIFHGVLIAIGIDNLVALACGLMLRFFGSTLRKLPDEVPSAVFFYFGVTQLLWLGPPIAFLLLRKQTRTASGVAIVAGITFVLNVLYLVITYAWSRS